MNNVKTLFIDTIKTFFTKPTSLIISIVFLLSNIFFIIILPKLILELPYALNPAADSYILNSFGYVLTIFVIFTCLLSHITFDVNETTFIFTSPISRNKFIWTKILTQIFILWLFALVAIGCWFILDAAFFPSKAIPGPGYPTPPQTIFEKGMTKSAVTIPFLLSVPACSFVVASLKWFKKEWISLACLPVLTLLLITPYILIVQLGLHVGDKIEPYAITNTLVMPSVFFGVISILGIIINALIPKYIKVRI